MPVTIRKRASGLKNEKNTGIFVSQEFWKFGCQVTRGVLRRRCVKLQCIGRLWIGIHLCLPKYTRSPILNSLLTISNLEIEVAANPYDCPHSLGSGRTNLVRHFLWAHSRYSTCCDFGCVSSVTGIHIRSLRHAFSIAHGQSDETSAKSG